MVRLLAITVIAGVTILSFVHSEFNKILPELKDGKVLTKDIGILSDNSVYHRQDPSGILKAGQTWYVYYGRGPKGMTYQQKSGVPFYIDIVCATSDDQGLTWKEHGEIFAEYDGADWHSTMRHAPHVVQDDGRFYMYFSYMDQKDRTKKIALATADNPLGPFEVDESGPKIYPGESYDNALVDDACVIKYKGKWCLYYKGRAKGTSPEESFICLATSDQITGPWEKQKGNLFQCHTAHVWPHWNGVAAISARPDYEILYAEDGVSFIYQTTTEVKLRDSGSYCPDAFDNDGFGQGVEWGLYMIPKPGGNFFKYWYSDMKVND